VLALSLHVCVINLVLPEVMLDDVYFVTVKTYTPAIDRSKKHASRNMLVAKTSGF